MKSRKQANELVSQIDLVWFCLRLLIFSFCRVASFAIQFQARFSHTIYSRHRMYLSNFVSIICLASEIVSLFPLFKSTKTEVQNYL